PGRVDRLVSARGELQAPLVHDDRGGDARPRKVRVCRGADERDGRSLLRGRLALCARRAERETEGKEQRRGPIPGGVRKEARTLLQGRFHDPVIIVKGDPQASRPARRGGAIKTN